MYVLYLHTCQPHDCIRTLGTKHVAHIVSYMVCLVIFFLPFRHFPYVFCILYFDVFRCSSFYFMFLLCTMAVIQSFDCDGFFNKPFMNE